MARYFTIGEILQGDEATEENARDYARQIDWSECQPEWQSIGHANHIDTIDGIGIYHDYAADYYFFTDEGSQKEAT